MAYTREQAMEDLKKARSVITKTRRINTKERNDAIIEKYNAAVKMVNKGSFSTQSAMIKKHVDDVLKDTGKLTPKTKQTKPRKPNRSVDEISKEWETKQLKALRRAVKQKDSWLGDNLSDKDLEKLFSNKQLRWDEYVIQITNDFKYGDKMINSSNVKITNAVNRAQRDKIRGQ